MNRLTVIGNLTKDPELRFAANGNARASFSVADSRSYKDKNGEWQEETSFYSCVLWGPAAENMVESLQKGHRVIIVGRLQQRSYDTDSGEKRSVVEIVVDEIGPSTKYVTIEGIKKAERVGPTDSAAAPADNAAVTAGDEVSEEPF